VSPAGKRIVAGKVPRWRSPREHPRLSEDDRARRIRRTRPHLFDLFDDPMLGRDHVFGHPALTDRVTGLGNRLHFELVYSYLFHGADRGVPLTVLMVSIPESGHDVLAPTGAAIQEATRVSDLVAHLGDGRFAILLLSTNLSGGRIVADRLEVSLASILTEQSSLALASYHPDMNEPHELLEAADRALQQVQERGGGLEMISE